MTEMASLVLYAGNPTATAAFYRALGLDLVDEDHGEDLSTSPFRWDRCISRSTPPRHRGGPWSAVWNPGTGALKTIGRGSWAMAAYTPPGARYSLLALMPARCSAGQDCPLKITNTATLSTKTLRSPLHHGFATGAAFSPDGKQLAVFADRNFLGTGAVQLAMVNTGTGTLRLVDSTRLAIGEDRAWALWLPDGRHLITGAAEASYAVNTTTLSARPLFFTHARDHYIQTSQDINYSAALIPPRR